MFSHLRSLERHNLRVHRMFVELTDRLGQDGMFGRTLNLDIQKDALTLSHRRGPWSFMWGYTFVNPEARGLGTIDVFMGKPGSLIKISSLFAFLPKDDRFELQMASDTTSASEEFVKMRDEISRQTDSSRSFIRSALWLAAFFLTQPD